MSDTARCDARSWEPISSARASTEELTKLEELLRREMSAGALGLSTGLEYDPGIYSKPDEVVALARVVAPMGGRYISHIRSEDRAFWEAVDEVIDIGARRPAFRCRSRISSSRCAACGVRPRSLIGVLDRARASGVRVTADIYPYRTGSPR